LALLEALQRAADEAQQAIARLTGEVVHWRAAGLLCLTHTTVQRWKHEMLITPMLVAAA
jgi:hypothetical protein